MKVQLMKTELKVAGMNCNHCISKVNKVITALQNDAIVTVDLPKQQVSIESSITVDELITALTEAGYPATAL